MAKEKEMRGRKKENGSFAPPGSLFRAEIDGAPNGLRVLISGVSRLSDITKTRLEVRAAGGKTVLVTGSGNPLGLTVYENQTVEVTGGVEEIRFVYRKPKPE